MRYTVRLNKRTGTLEFLGGPPPGLKLPNQQRTRFSEIVPADRAKLRWYRFFRAVFGERGRVAEWTRNWRCKWESIILQGPQRGRRAFSYNRNQLIDWEQHVWKGEIT